MKQSIKILNKLSNTDFVAATGVYNVRNLHHVKSKEFESKVLALLIQHKLIPATDLKGSEFSQKPLTVCGIDSDGKLFDSYQKLVDFYLPVENLYIECTERASDGKEHETYSITQGLTHKARISDKNDTLGVTPDYVLFHEKPLSPTIERRLLDNGVKYIVGLPAIDKYLSDISKKRKKIQRLILNMGYVKMIKFTDLVDNDINRKINWPHVYKLVNSIRTLLNGGKIEVGLIRPFTAIYVKKKLMLVDAHHLKEAVKILKDFYNYKVDSVPVMVLGHLNNLSADEVAQLMSSLNTITLKWDNFSYVNSWEVTFYKLIAQFTAKKNVEKVKIYKNKHYPYKTLRDDILEVAGHYGGKKPLTGGVSILPAYGFTDLASVSNWGSNMNLVKIGELSYNEHEYMKYRNPIKNAIINLITAHYESRKSHTNLLKVHKGGLFIVNENDDTKRKFIFPKISSKILQQLATSLRVLSFKNESLFEEVVELLTKEFWKNTFLPEFKTQSNFEKVTSKKILSFPDDANKMKLFIEGDDENGIRGGVINFMTKQLKIAAKK
jgi:hypothetical protein